MSSRILYLIRKEVRQAFREPRMRAMLFIPPIIQLLIFGYAVNLDVEHAAMAWVDQDRTPQSQELLSKFEGSKRFDVIATPSSEREIAPLLDSGDADLVVRVLSGFGRDVLRGKTTSVQVLVNGSNSNTASLVAAYELLPFTSTCTDVVFPRKTTSVQVLVNGSNSNTASLVAAYATGVIGGYARDVMNDQAREKLVGRTAGGPIHPAIPSVNLQSRVWFNPDLKSRNYFVPGVVANIIALVTLMLTAMAIVREKEIGTMEQLMVTPIKPIELMIGKTLPFAVVGIVDMVLVVVVARLLFHVPFRGNVLLLVLATVCFLLTSLGVGLFISTISRKQKQGIMTTFLFFQPFFLLSG